MTAFLIVAAVWFSLRCIGGAMLILDSAKSDARAKLRIRLVGLCFELMMALAAIQLLFVR